MLTLLLMLASSAEPVEGRMLWHRADTPEVRGITEGVIVTGGIETQSRILSVMAISLETGETAWRFDPNDPSRTERYFQFQNVFSIGTDMLLRASRQDPQADDRVDAGYLWIRGRDGTIRNFLPDPVDCYMPVPGEGGLYFLFGQSRWPNRVTIVRWDGDQEIDWELGESMEHRRAIIYATAAPTLTPRAGGGVLMHFPTQGFAMANPSGRLEWIFPTVGFRLLGQTRDHIFFGDDERRIQVLDLTDGRSRRGSDLPEELGNNTSSGQVGEYADGTDEYLLARYSLVDGTSGFIGVSSRGRITMHVQEDPRWYQILRRYLVADQEGRGRERDWLDITTGRPAWEHESVFGSNPFTWPSTPFLVMPDGTLVWLTEVEAQGDEAARVDLNVKPVGSRTPNTSALPLTDLGLVGPAENRILAIDASGRAWEIDPVAGIPVWQAPLSAEAWAALQREEGELRVTVVGTRRLLLRGRVAVALEGPAEEQSPR